jgi:hypothetical protein
MKRREVKQRIREVWQETFAGLDPADEAARATRVRELCPCEHAWSVPLWDVIFAACEDPSPLVRLEALHVIEDAYTLGIPHARGLGLIFAARQDPAPEVRRFAEEIVRLLPRLREVRNQRRNRRNRVTREDTDDGGADE